MSGTVEEGFPKGCKGAVNVLGNPSKRKCQGGWKGKHSWWEKCCQWNEESGSCEENLQAYWVSCYIKRIFFLV